MNHFYVITNEDKDRNLRATKEVRNYLLKHGKVCYLGIDSQSRRNGEEETRPEDVPEDTECIIVLGGDGTLLRAARNLVDRGIPLIGINMGTLGYLTEGDTAGIPDILERLIADEYIVEERMMLTGRIIGPDGEVIAQDVALNDLTLNRTRSVQVFRFKIYVNGEFLYLYNADGIIISTPTGSTAYNLSCGGPIVEPTAKLFLVTPIAPHSLNNRSLILSCRDRIELEILGHDRFRETRAEYITCFDGDTEIPVKAGYRIEIWQAEQKTRILTMRQQSFLETLRVKMN